MILLYRKWRQKFCGNLEVYCYLPMSSINGAIRKVTPTSNRHIKSSRQAVAIIVHLARCDKSFGSITYGPWRNMIIKRIT